MTQSRTMSLIEALMTVIVGYALGIATQLAVLPLFGLEAALGEPLAIGMAFVGVSLVRGYVLRRVFERLGKGFWATHTPTYESAKKS